MLIYQGEEMEEDEETMADYDIQVKDFLEQPTSPTWDQDDLAGWFSVILLQPKLASGFIPHPNSVVD